MKKVLIVLVLSIILLITGCSDKGVEVGIDNDIEENKISYLNIKDELTKQDEFNSKEDLPCKVTASIDRINEEEISYRVILDNPTRDMKDVQALLVHNKFSEDIFPSIGIFDEKSALIVNDEEVKGITLVGYIETTSKMSDLDLELRLWLKYKDSEDNIKEIYYKIEDIEYNDKVSTKDDTDVVVE